MAYSKTTWANGTTPAINADNLNKIEQGIYDATKGIENVLTILKQDVPLAGLGEFVNKRWDTGSSSWKSNSYLISNTTPLYLPFDVYLKPLSTYRIRIIYWTNGETYSSQTDFVTIKTKINAGSYITLTIQNGTSTSALSTDVAYNTFHASVFEYDDDDITAKTNFNYGSIPVSITSMDDIDINSIYFIGSSGGVPAVPDAPIYPCWVVTTVQNTNRFQICYPYLSDSPTYRSRNMSGVWNEWKTFGGGSSGRSPVEYSLKEYSICCFGDSITAGSGATIPYHYYETLFGHHTCKNYGIGRTGYLATTTVSDYRGIGEIGQASILTNNGNNTVKEYIAANANFISSSDVITIAAGTNDFGGAWGSGGGAASTEEEAKQAFEIAIRDTYEYVLENFTVPLIVCTPVRRERTINSLGITLKWYVDKIKEVCEEMGIPVIDFYDTVGLHPEIEDRKDYYYVINENTGHGDGTHPNNLGHQMMGSFFGSKLDEYLDRRY